MTPNYIVCGKLHSCANLGDFVPNATSKVRIFAERMMHNRSTTSVPIAVGKNEIWFEGQPWEMDSFLSMASVRNIQRLLVLTSKEYLQVVESAAAHSLCVDVFEIDFPIFGDTKYHSNPRINYEALTKNLQKLKQLGVSSTSFSKHVANRYQRSVARELKFKNNLDRHFFLAYKDGYQEVFKLKEERSDRVVIALDFNSMYLDSMRGEFCNPASIEYKDFRQSTIEPGDLKAGVYRVRLLAAKQSFLLTHHPFRYKQLGRSYYFQMNPGDTIETLLHKNEIDYFLPFFEDIEIIEGLFSHHKIAHPLSKKGQNLYAQRIYHRQRGDRIKESLCKFSIQHMHSATNQKRFSRKQFGSMEEIRSFLSSQFAMNLDTISLGEIVDFLQRNKYFKLVRNAQGFQLSYLDAGNSSNVFSLSAQVIANARVKMLQTLERFLSHRSVELCYANIDSIHISINKDEVADFFETHQDIISDELGALKVEAIADKGYWFDVGRYWLKKEGEVVLFKNKGFNQKNATDPFISRRKISNFVQTPTFAHLHTYVMKIENSFACHHKLDHRTSQESRFVRFDFHEIKDSPSANLAEALEQLKSMKIKVDLFRHISAETKAKIRDV